MSLSPGMLQRLGPPKLLMRTLWSPPKKVLLFTAGVVGDLALPPPVEAVLLFF